MSERKRQLLPFGSKQSERLASFPPDLSFDTSSPEWAKTFADSLAFHVYMERYVNKGAYHSYRHYSEVSQEYRPLDGAPSFLLPYVIIPRENARIYEVQPNDELKNSIIGEDGIRFFIHPDMVQEYEKQGVRELSSEKINGSVEVVPTSSTRTMFANIGDRLTMAKVDMSGKRLGRLTRALPERSIVRSNFVSGLMAEIAAAEGFPEEMAYFPETLGVGISVGDKNYANLHREYVVTPDNPRTKYILPVFSLYSPDVNNPANPLLIQQLIRSSGLSPEDFFEQKVARPMVRNTLYMAFRHGLLLEAHPQNTLIELDSDFNVSRYIYRDLQTVIVDTNIREKEGLPTNPPEGAKLLAQWQEDLDQFAEYSIFYDHRIAYQTIEEVILALASKYPCHIALLQGIVKKVFNEVVDELNINKDEYFPKDYYYLYQDGFMENNVMKMKRFNDPPYR